MKFLKYAVIVIVVLVLIFIGKGLLSPAVTYESQVVVNKPASVCWAVMQEEKTLPKWIKGFKKAELISGERGAVGAISKMYVEDGGEEMIMEETITAVIPNELMAMTFTMDMMTMNYQMRLKEEGGKTTITTESNTVGNGILYQSIISFMPDAMKAQEDENLSNLKGLIEESSL